MKTIQEYNKLYKCPIVCEACGHELIINTSGFPECVFIPCPRKLSHRYKKMFDVLEIRGAGPVFISNLEKYGITIEDFFEKIENNDKDFFCRMANSINGKKILQQLKDALSKPITVPKFLATFDYEGFDEKKLKFIDKSIEKCYNLSIEELKQIDGFADITANLFVKFMNEKKEEAECLKKYFNFSKGGEKSEGKINGVSFCFTGKSVKPRSELEKMVIASGGLVKSSVTKGLNYLVTDDTESGSSKNVKAKQLGISVISSTEFLNML